jgi:uncharacterized protein YjdB
VWGVLRWLLGVVVVVTVVGGVGVGVASADYTFPDPALVCITNGEIVCQGSNLSAFAIANALATTNINIQATDTVEVLDCVDLSTSTNGTPQFDLRLIAPAVKVDCGLNLAASGNLVLTALDLELNGRITSGGTDINPSRVTGTATQVDVVSNAASVQQGIDFSSATTPPTVEVGAGQYSENLTIAKPLTLSGDDGAGPAGAGPNAPTIVGSGPAGNVITAMAGKVTVDGLHVSGVVAAGSLASSVHGVSAPGVDELTVSHNTFDGFSGTAIDDPGATNVTTDANVITPTATGVSVSPATGTVTVGATQQFSATGADTEGGSSDLTGSATWSSSDPTIATIDASGLARGVSPGTATITATSGGFSATAALTVDAPSAGSCSGALVLGKITPGLTDSPQNETITTSLLKDTTTKAAIGGTCNNLVQNAQDTALNGPPPAVIHPSAVATKLIGTASCQADESGTYPLTGKQTTSSATNELNNLGKKWQIQAYITIQGFDPAALDVVDVTGIVAKGLSVGAVETGTYWENPVVKGTDPEGDGTNNPTADGANHNDDNIFNSGYSVDDTNALNVLVGCLTASPQGEIPQAGAITQVAFGGGGATALSPLLASTANGASFTLGQ